MKNIVIIGAGDLGKEVVWLIEDINRIEPTYVILGFLDDTEEKQNKEFAGYRVLGKTEYLEELNSKIPVCAVIAVQSGEGRNKIVEEHQGFHSWENIIHPTAVIAASSTYELGNIFFPQTVVSAECKIGNFTLLYPQVTIGMNSTIRDYASLFLRVSVDDHAEVEKLATVDANNHVNAYAIHKNIKPQKIAIIGGGGCAKEVAEIIRAINNKHLTYDLLGFLVDEKYCPPQEINGYPRLGNTDWAIEHKETIRFVCAIGDARPREIVMNRLMDQGVKFESIIAPNAYIGRFSLLGEGCILYWGAGISVNCKLGKGVLMNANTTIGHDVEVGDYSTLSPASELGGRVVVGKTVSIGSHSYVLPDKKVKDYAVIAAGSIVFSNVKESTTVLGNPARRMKEIED